MIVKAKKRVIIAYVLVLSMIFGMSQPGMLKKAEAYSEYTVASGKAGIVLSNNDSMMAGYQLLIDTQGYISNWEYESEQNNLTFDSFVKLTEDSTRPGFYTVDYASIGGEQEGEEYDRQTGYVYLYKAGETDPTQHIGCFQFSTYQSNVSEDYYDIVFRSGRVETKELCHVEYTTGDFPCEYVPQERYYTYGQDSGDLFKDEIKEKYEMLGGYILKNWQTVGEEPKVLRSYMEITEDMVVEPNFVSEDYQRDVNDYSYSDYAVDSRFQNMEHRQVTSAAAFVYEARTTDNRDGTAFADAAWIEPMCDMTIDMSLGREVFGYDENTSEYALSTMNLRYAGIVVPSGVALTISGMSLNGYGFDEVRILVKDGGTLNLVNSPNSYSWDEPISVQSGGALNLNNYGIETEHLTNFGTINQDIPLTEYGTPSYIGINIAEKLYNASTGSINISGGCLGCKNSADMFDETLTEEERIAAAVQINKGDINLTGSGYFFVDGPNPGTQVSTYNIPFLNEGTIKIDSVMPSTSYYQNAFSIDGYTKFNNYGRVEVTGTFPVREETGYTQDAVEWLGGNYGMDIYCSVFNNYGEVVVDTKDGNGIRVYGESEAMVNRTNCFAEFNNYESGTISITTKTEETGLFLGRVSTLNNYGSIEATSTSDSKIDNVPIVLTHTVNNSGTIINRGMTGYYRSENQKYGQDIAVSGNAIEDEGREAVFYEIGMTTNDRFEEPVTITMGDFSRTDSSGGYGAAASFFVPVGEEQQFTAASEGYEDFTGTLQPAQSGAAYNESYNNGGSTRVNYKMMRSADVNKEYTISYIEKEGRIADENYPTSYKFGTEVQLPTNVIAEEDGYEFAGWLELGDYEMLGIDYDEVKDYLVTTISATDYGDKEFWPVFKAIGENPLELGDVAGNDGKIDLDDVNLVLKIALTIKTPTEAEKKAADVNKDGLVDLDDTNLVLKYALTIIDSFD